jgi:hypothetical protein
MQFSATIKIKIKKKTSIIIIHVITILNIVLINFITIVLIIVECRHGLVQSATLA